MDSNYSLADIAAATGDMGGANSFFWIFALLILAGGGGIFGNRGIDGYASAASQQEILFNQHFNNLDNKMDRGFTSIGNGIADATYALTNNIKDGNAAVAGKVEQVRFDMANYHADTNAVVAAQTQKVLDAISQNKIEALQGRINQLELQSAMCGVVKYPLQTTYTSGGHPFCGCNNGCCGY